MRSRAGSTARTPRVQIATCGELAGQLYRDGSSHLPAYRVIAAGEITGDLRGGRHAVCRRADSTSRQYCAHEPCCVRGGDVRPARSIITPACQPHRAAAAQRRAEVLR